MARCRAKAPFSWRIYNGGQVCLSTPHLIAQRCIGGTIGEMTKTLIEKAKASRSVPGFRRSYRYGRQVEDLAIAWFRGQISFGQAASATGVKGSSLYGLLAVSLRNA